MNANNEEKLKLCFLVYYTDIIDFFIKASLLNNWVFLFDCSCVASNSHGKGRGQLTLTGTAGLAVFDSPPLGTEKDTYNISWSVNSHAAITEYRLFYRQQPHHHHGHHQELIFNNSKMIYRNDWNSVVLPGAGVTNLQIPLPPPFPGVTRQKMWYTVRSLHPSTTYEARVQARNQHGWNKLSPIFHFTTRSNGNFL